MMIAYVAWLLPFEKMLAARAGARGASASAALDEWLASATSRHVGVELTVADYRHVAIELGRKIRGLVVRQLEVDMGVDDGGQAADGEAGGGGGYGYGGKGAAEAAAGTGKVRKRQVAGIAGGGRKDNYDGRFKRKKTTAAAGPDGNDDGDDDEKGGRVDIEAGLRKLFGRDAGWRSDEQQDGMAKIMALQVERLGTTVVVVPFVALMDDLVKRAKAFGVDCIRWQPAARTGRDEPLREARLVVVSADLAGCNEFMAYADGLRARGLLRRIFIDECYTIIMDAGYRERLAALKGLYRFDRPVILLTATLPVRLERWFRQEMVAGDTGVVRAATVKQNIRYRVTTVAAGKTAVEDEVGIVAVVHMEQPYGLVDFVQQTGRGGRRDGEVVESVIVTDGRAAWYDRQGSDVEQQNRQAMEWFVASVDCRRVALGAFMDGQGRDCEEVGGERCDRCRRDGAATASPDPEPEPGQEQGRGQKNRLKK
ncbi:hypothetical protein DL771_011356 [Monosporascus sp. 5C6A]|nr:hypothetical protein DL771_011356 [Monosporascus sp. 5C6A]